MFTLHKPNSQNTGALVSFKIGAPEKNKADINIYAEIVRQSGWNAQTKTGTFSGNSNNPDGKVKVKLNEIEVGGIINAIKYQGSWKGYHTMNDNKTQLAFTFSTRDNGSQAFIFSILRNGTDKFAVGIKLDEAEVLLVALEFFLLTRFRAAYALEAEYFQNRQAQGNQPQTQQQRPAQRPAANPQPQQQRRQQPARPTVETAPVEQDDFDSAPQDTGVDDVSEQGDIGTGDENPFG